MSWKYTLESDAVLLRIINGLRAETVQSYDEINKKRGMQWEASRVVTLAGSASTTSIFKTGALPVDLKQRAFAFDGIGITASIFKAPTYTGGTATSAFNFRTDTTTGLLTTLFIDPIVTNNGTKCGADIYAIGPSSPTSRGMGLIIYPGNRILEPNTTYLLTITNRDTNASQIVSSRIEFYEGAFDYPNQDYA